MDEMTITEIQKLSVGKITYGNLVKMTEFVFKTIPWRPQNFSKSHTLSIREYCDKCSKKELGGWCDANASFLRRLFNACGLWSKRYDYGLPKFSHVVTLVDLNGQRYIMDPYFCRHYIDLKGNPITFERMLKLIENKNFNHIKPIYGNCLKDVEQPYGWVRWTGMQLEESVLGSWKINDNYDNIMQRKFGEINPLVLMITKRALH